MRGEIESDDSTGPTTRCQNGRAIGRPGLSSAGDG